MELVLLIVLGLAAGTLGSILGLGGGFLVVPALILLKDTPDKIATGTSVAIIVPAMLVALWGRASHGHVDWRIAGLVAIGAIVGAYFGSNLAAKLDPLWIRRAFSGILVVLAVILFFKK